MGKHGKLVLQIFEGVWVKGVGIILEKQGKLVLQTLAEASNEEEGTPGMDGNT